MTVNQRLQALRSEMSQKGIDAYVILSADPHNSEYVADHWAMRSWISGFTGSAGTAVVTADFAGLWTDGRYLVQGETELADSEFQLMLLKVQGKAEWLEYLVDHLKEGQCIGTYGACLPLHTQSTMVKACRDKNIRIETAYNLIGDIWEGRPALTQAAIVVHDIAYSIIPAEEKIKNILAQRDGADYILITALDEIAWALNVRGRDVNCNPVFYSYLLLHAGGGTLFIDPNKLSTALQQYFASLKIDIDHYENIFNYLGTIDSDQSIQLDPVSTNYNIIESINGQVIKKRSPAMFLKGIKSPKEIEHVRNAMIKDGAALAKTFYWMEEALASGQKVIETDIAEQLAHNRASMPGYYDESFNAIVGYRSNGAIIHYKPEKETCAEIKAEGILLVDSGGQYIDGTTDITRTIAFGPVADYYKSVYTRVLLGMIHLSQAIFPEGTTGLQLDILARLPLWMHGQNYSHGTGHGVGYFMNVHEPPQGFVPVHNERGKTVLEIGMITSNEPGHYVEGDYGMRIENLIVVEPAEHDGFLQHETLTVYPFDLSLIDKNVLSSIDRDWVNSYHDKCFNQIAPLLTASEQEWFKEKCKHI